MRRASPKQQTEPDVCMFATITSIIKLQLFKIFSCLSMSFHLEFYRQESQPVTFPRFHALWLISMSDQTRAAHTLWDPSLPGTSCLGQRRSSACEPNVSCFLFWSWFTNDLWTVEGVFHRSVTRRGTALSVSLGHHVSFHSVCRSSRIRGCWQLHQVTSDPDVFSAEHRNRLLDCRR